jgi:hypothetical protein
MPSQRRWRQRLLGSLQGQLQLATYLVVFAWFYWRLNGGFVGGSTEPDPQRNTNTSQQCRANSGIASVRSER